MSKITGKALLRQGLKIHTVYYNHNRAVKRNNAKYGYTAVMQCIKHMQLNSYEATHAEVYDSVDGKLHAVIRAVLVNGKHEIRILFKREFLEDVKDV